MATIWDADLMIYLASHLNELRERGDNDLSPTIRLLPGDLLRRICWGVSGLVTKHRGQGSRARHLCWPDLPGQQRQRSPPNGRDRCSGLGAAFGKDGLCPIPERPGARSRRRREAPSPATLNDPENAPHSRPVPPPAPGRAQESDGFNGATHEGHIHTKSGVED